MIPHSHVESKFWFNILYNESILKVDKSVKKDKEYNDTKHSKILYIAMFIRSLLYFTVLLKEKAL